MKRFMNALVICMLLSVLGFAAYSVFKYQSTEITSLKKALSNQSKEIARLKDTTHSNQNAQSQDQGKIIQTVKDVPQNKRAGRAQLKGTPIPNQDDYPQRQTHINLSDPPPTPKPLPASYFRSEEVRNIESKIVDYAESYSNFEMRRHYVFAQKYFKISREDVAARIRDYELSENMRDGIFWNFIAEDTKNTTSSLVALWKGIQDDVILPAISRGDMVKADNWRISFSGFDQLMIKLRFDVWFSNNIADTLHGSTNLMNTSFLAYPESIKAIRINSKEELINLARDEFKRFGVVVVDWD